MARQWETECFVVPGNRRRRIMENEEKTAVMRMYRSVSNCVAWEIGNNNNNSMIACTRVCIYAFSLHKKTRRESELSSSPPAVIAVTYNSTKN